MSDNQNPEVQAQRIAGDIATHELLRLIIAEAFFSPDRDEFRRKISALEGSAVNSIMSRRLFPQADDATETYIKEAASGFISRLLGSIRHPADPQR